MRALSPALQLMTPLSDAELVARILAGDTAAFELIMRRYNQRLFRVARSVVRTDDEAEDVVQETYLRAFENLARFEGRASLPTWLSRIALHEALRRRRRRARAPSGLDPDALPAPRGHASPPDAAAGEEMRALLTGAVDALPPLHRSVVMLRLVEGLGTGETAESLGLTEANVKITLHRARRMLFETIQRRAIPELRRQFAFDGERCDRIVAAVFARLAAAPALPRAPDAEPTF